MGVNDKIRIRKWRHLKYHNPRATLLTLRNIEKMAPGTSLPYSVRSLRTNRLKKYREWRQAALFCCGMEHVLGTDLLFAQLEEEDFDIVAAWRQGEERVFAPVQIKELVPSRVDTKAEIENLLEGLKKYACSAETIVAIHMNRTQSLDLSKIVVPELNVSEIWLFGGLSTDQSRWFLYGDMLSGPRSYEFDYPT